MTNKLNELENTFLEGNIDKKDYIDRMYQYHDFLFQYSDFIKQRDISKIEITDSSVMMTTRDAGIKLMCQRYDQRIAAIETLNFKKYEADEYEMIMKLVKDGDTVFDIGGNIGYYSIALEKSKSNLDIHAFEPIPKTYEYFVANKHLNGCTAKIYNFGLSNENKDLTFFFYKEGSGNASSALMDDTRETETITCTVTKLDDFIIKNNIKKLDFIKCDVEGAELFVFQGGIETIKKHKPIIFTEILRKWSAKFNYHPNDIINLLAEIGYECFVNRDGNLQKIGFVDDNTVETNFFFICKV